MDLVEFDPSSACRHPWEEVRFRFFARVLARAGLLSPGTSILDAGAGDAWFGRQLVRLSPAIDLTCWDPGYDETGRPPDPRAVQERIRFVRERPPRPVSVLLLLDVLEHVPDDAGFLHELVRDAVEPGGHVLISVPAWPALFSAHDVHLRHHRRYAPAAARRVLCGAGLEIVRAGGLFHMLLLPRALQKLGEHARRRASHPPDLGQWDAPRPVTALLRGVLSLDAWVGEMGARVGWELPGLSWWALCRKPSR